MKLYKNNFKYKILFCLFIAGIILLIIPIKFKTGFSFLPETGEEAIDLSCEFSVDKKDIQKDAPEIQNKLLNYRVKVKNDTECKTSPLDIVLLLDTSGSMSKNLENIKTTLTYIIDSLDFSLDQAGIVTFNDTAIVKSHLSNSKVELSTSIADLYPSGLSNLTQGLETAKQELSGNYSNAKAKKVIILFSDGEFDRPKDESNNTQMEFAKESAINKAVELRIFGVEIISIDFNTYTDYETLKQISLSDVNSIYKSPGENDITYLYRSLSEDSNTTSYDTKVNINLSRTNEYATLENYSIEGRYIDNDLSWDIGHVLCQESYYLTFSLKLKESVKDLDIIDLIAEVTNSLENKVNSKNVITNIHAPILSLSISDNKDYALPNDLLDYKIKVENQGSGNAYSVKVVDSVNELFLINNNSINENGKTTNSQITWDNGGEGYILDGSNEPTNSSWGNKLNLQFSGFIDKNLLEGIYDIENNVLLSTQTGYIQESKDITNVPYAPDLTITKTSQPSTFIYPGGIINYTLNISNNGYTDANNIVVSDEFNNTLKSVNASNADVSSNSITWRLDKLQIGGSKELSYTAFIKDNIPDEKVINTATIISSDPDININNNTSTKENIVTEEPVLSIKKETNKRAYEISEEIEVKIIISNNSISNAFNVTIEEQIPQSFKYLESSAKLNGETFENPQGENILKCELKNLKKDEMVELIYKMQINDSVETDNYSINSILYWQNDSSESFEEHTSELISITKNEFSLPETGSSQDITTSQNILSKKITKYIKAAFNKISRSKESVTYIKVLIGLLLALPFPIVLIIEYKNNGKNKLKDLFTKT